jgi:hypothetical protein
MMYHKLLADASFWAFLFTIDQDLARKCAEHGCSCGGRLHVANYPRKPRGGPRDLPEQYRYRLSFCCNRDGCRKRVTPQSVRFLGRKVYLGAVVVLVAAMRQGPNARRIRELTKLFDVDQRTLYRWRNFWNEHFPRTKFWKVARARLVPVFNIVDIPRSLLEAFVRSADDRDGWGKLLDFLSPISTTKGLEIKLSEAHGQPAEDANFRL